MQMNATRILIGIALCTLTACATEPAFISLTPELSQRIRSSNGVILATQKEIIADVDKSNVAMYTGGGLIPALIDVAIESSRASSSEKALKPIRDVLVNYEVGSELHRALGTRLEAVPWLQTRKIEIIHDNKANQITHLLTASSEDALLVLTPTYRFSSDFSVLRFQTELQLIPRSTHLMPQNADNDAEKRMSPLYKTTIIHLEPLTNQTSSTVDAAMTWASEDGRRIKKALQQGIARSADQIIEALSHPERTPTAP